MRGTAGRAAAAALLAAGCGRGGPVPAAVVPDSPEALVRRALARAGGDALADARVLAWDGTAVVTAGGRTLTIAGTWRVRPPDTAVVTTYDVARGPATARALVVAAPRGWIVGGVAPDSTPRFAPMPPALLASERDEFSLYDAMRLAPLLAPGVALRSAAPDSLGRPGVRAERPGRPAVELWFDADGRLAHLAAAVSDAGGGAPVRQELWFEGEHERGGVRWPRRVRIVQGGRPFFDLTVRAFRVLPRLDSPLVAGPPGGPPAPGR